MATLLLSDTTYLLSHLSHGQYPAPGLASLLDSSIKSFVTIKTARHGPSKNHDDRAEGLMRHAEALGIDTSAGSSFASGFEEYLQRRDGLVAACRDDGWPPSELE